MTKLAIIADDLTGAADAAVAFANRGHSSQVLLDPTFSSGAEIIAITTESRHLPPALAAERVRGVSHHLYGTPLLYKKIDSTLRGNIAAELFALMEAFEVARALVAPAFPAQGRTTVHGRQLIDGRPLEETDFGSQIVSSNIREIFLRARDARPVRLMTLADVRREIRYLTEHLTDRRAGITIADAETEEDMTAIAEAVLASSLRLACGSAGLCHALAGLIPASHDRSTGASPALSGPILTIAGSIHATTIAQVEAARAAGMTVIEPVDFGIYAIEPLIDQAAELLEKKKDVILASHQIDASTPSELTISDRLSLFTYRLLKRVPAGGLVLTGGDVASAVCRELGVRAIDLFGEVQPGIPYGVLRSLGADNLPVVTKAGGFGDADALVKAIEFLRGG